MARGEVNVFLVGRGLRRGVEVEVVADTTGFVETAVVRGELNGAFAECSKDKLELLGVLLCVCVLAEAPFSSCGAGFFNGDLNGERKGFERVCVAA